MGTAKRITYGVGGLALFVISLQTLGRATQALTPVFEQLLKTIIRGDLSALGAGWTASYLLMNGASVAALALSMFKSNLLSVTELFMAVSGSRMGAAFIVVVIGYLQYLQGKNKDLTDSCSIGILNFIVSYLMYIPAIILGMLWLYHYSPGEFYIAGLESLQYSITAVFDPVVDWIISTLTTAPSFIISFIGLFLSLKVFDKAFKGISAKKFKNKYFRFVMTHNWVSFLFGTLTTLLTTSVSISVGLVVPLYNRGYVKRKEIIPYLVGANLATLISSFLAALVLDTSLGFNITLVLAFAVLIPSILAMLFYGRFFSTVKWIFDSIVSDNRFMTGFIVVLIVMPLVLLIF